MWTSQPAQTTASSPEHRRQIRALPLLIVGALVIALIIAMIMWRSNSGHPATATVSVSRDVAGVRSVDLNGLGGRVTIAVGDGSQITASALPVDGHAAPDLAFRMDPATGDLYLICSGPGTAPSAISCPATTYSVLIPQHVAVSLREDSGQATLIGLSGPVAVTASSIAITAQALSTDDFSASITSGTLDATFASTPAHVAVTVTSAEASLHLPDATAYQVQQHAVSAHIDVGVPQSAASTHVIQATATSGTINLLAS